MRCGPISPTIGGPSEPARDVDVPAERARARSGARRGAVLPTPGPRRHSLVGPPHVQSRHPSSRGPRRRAPRRRPRTGDLDAPPTSTTRRSRSGAATTSRSSADFRVGRTRATACATRRSPPFVRAGNVALGAGRNASRDHSRRADARDRAVVRGRVPRARSPLASPPAIGGRRERGLRTVRRDARRSRRRSVATDRDAAPESRCSRR